LDRKRVLIVEDNFLIAENIAHAILDHGFDVIGQVDNADRAICIIEEQRPDGVLLDVQLRRGSAVKVAEALDLHGIPFVVVSGSSQDRLPPALSKAPYLGKPMTELQLVEAARRTFDARMQN
jgi:DNA-binding NarL/FixJ family response regulator